MATGPSRHKCLWVQYLPRVPDGRPKVPQGLRVLLRLGQGLGAAPVTSGGPGSEPRRPGKGGLRPDPLPLIGIHITARSCPSGGRN